MKSRIKQTMMTGLSVVALLAVGTLSAQAAGMSVQLQKGFYGALSVGPSFQEESELDTGFDLSAQAGYKFGNGFRLEGAVGYNEASREDFGFDGTLSNTSLMGNAFYDINTFGPFTPYVGAGLGAAFHDLEVRQISSGIQAQVNEDDAYFAWNVMAGLNYQIDPRMTVGAEYRYFKTSDPETVLGGEYKNGNHSVNAKISYHFN